MSYQSIKDRLYRGRRKIANNTYLTLEYYEVAPDAECIQMRLHGNLVAEFQPDYLLLFSAGWHTNTTKNRLNLALELAGIGYGIWQQNWTWYYRDPGIPFKDGMKLNYSGEVI